ncbi:MAG TPA: alkaline phosphatase family protein [bacterium]|nr:alkaline phosphatase family protein [bacterium]
MARRALVIALDGTTFDLIGPWMDDGSMPNLARLRDEGVSGPLDSVFPPVTACAWSTFMTAKNPGKHGVFEFFLRDPGGFDEIPVSSRTRAGRTLWDHLGGADKKVLVVNVPVTYPPNPVNGWLIGDFLTPMGKRDFTFPASLLEEVEAATGPYELYHVEVYRPGKGHVVLDELDRVLEANRRANLWLLQNKPWDFAMLHVWGTDRYGHELWHVLDQKHPAHDPAEALILRDRCLAYWRRVDAVVGEWMEAAPDATHIVLSDHGFGPIHNFLVFNVWLLERGFLRLKRDALTFVKRSLFELGLSPALGYRAAMKLGFARMRLAAGVGTRRRLLDRINKVFLSLSDVDWSRTRVYSKGNYGQMFLNLRGREPGGIVEPGEEAARVIGDVVAGLRELVDPETGGPLIGEIHTADDLYHGPFSGRAPDITFLPADMRNKALGTVDFTSHRFVERAYGNSGDHRMNGILLMRGEGIKAGVRLDDAGLIDVAPTILHHLGEPVPGDVDGRVLMSVFTNEEAARPVQIREVAAEADASEIGAGLTADEQEEIRRRLKGIGYLG